VGGRHLDQAVAAHLRRRHGLAIGRLTSEGLKLEIGSAAPEGDRRAEVRGRDLASGLPRVAVVGDEEIAGAIEEPLGRILTAIRRSLERTPPELASDVMDHGLMLAGGGARLHGLADRLRAELQIPVHLPDDPLVCVAAGAGMALEELGALRSTRRARPRGRLRRG
jgi:rod shape-determining protein MreB